MPKFSHYVCKRKELWVGFYDHDCCEFVWPFIPLFVLMTMVVVVNCVMIPILLCWWWGCCEWCDNFQSTVVVVLLWIVWWFIPLFVVVLLVTIVVVSCVMMIPNYVVVLWWCCFELCDNLFHCCCCCCCELCDDWLIPSVVGVYCCELCDDDSFILLLLMVVCLAVVGEQTNQRVFLHNSQKEQPLVCLLKNSRTTFVCFLKRSALFLVEET